MPNRLVVVSYPILLFWRGWLTVCPTARCCQASYGFGCPLQQNGAAISEVCLVWSPNLCRRLANSSKRTHKSARPNCALLPAIPFSLRAPKNMNQISKLVLADLGAVPSVTGGYLAVFVYDFGCPLWQNSALIGVCYIIAVSRARFVCVH